jgi:hypothetical protein
VSRARSLALAIALGAVASFLLLLGVRATATVFTEAGSDAKYAAMALILVGAAALFGTAALFASESTTGPRHWLAVAVISVIASFFPYPFIVGPVGLLLNAILTALAAGALVANVQGERRLAAGEHPEEAS